MFWITILTTEPLSSTYASLADYKHQTSQTNIRSIQVPATRNMCATEIDVALEQLGEAIRASMSEAIPVSPINHDNSVIQPPDILDLIAQKNRMRRRWERLRSRPIASQLKTEITLLSQIIDQRITLVRNEQWSRKLASIKPGPLMFRKIKSRTTADTLHTKDVDLLGQRH